MQLAQPGILPCAGPAAPRGRAAGAAPVQCGHDAAGRGVGPRLGRLEPGAAGQDLEEVFFGLIEAV
jgi:hypothetical protein